MHKYRITVLTPTYNRAYIIEQLYSSLKKQTFTDFEWLVIDDGSTDETDKLFNRLIQENNGFVIRYYKKSNGGKQSAVNYGLGFAQGEIFFVMDSDDILTQDALAKINQWFIEIKSDSKIKGITANKGFSETYTPNKYFDEDYLNKTFLEALSYKENNDLVLTGERAIAFYTDFHRQYRYPEFEGEKFITEAVVYNRMANDGYLMRFYNDIIWIYEYLEDGLTRSGSSIFINNPRGYGLWLREKAEFTHASFFEKLKMYYTFTCDLSGKYDTKLISEAIGAPYILIALVNTLHKLVQFFKK